MIQTQLKACNGLLDELITQTEQDLENIRKANHKEVDESVEKKNKLIVSFMQAKKELDNTLIKISNNGQDNLATLLDDEDKELLGEFKKRLITLQSKNKEYAKLVLVVKNFFDGLVHTMFDKESGTNNAYTNSKAELQALFKMNV